MEQILNQLSQYLIQLDWGFIITFIILAYGVNQNKVSGRISKVIGLKTKTRYRTTLLGLVYGSFLFIVRGYEITQVEGLVQSLVFALVFHKLLIEQTVRFFQNRVQLKNLFSGSNSQGHE